jgi:hypothetical protein
LSRAAHGAEHHVPRHPGRGRPVGHIDERDPSVQDEPRGIERLALPPLNCRDTTRVIRRSRRNGGQFRGEESGVIEEARFLALPRLLRDGLGLPSDFLDRGADQANERRLDERPGSEPGF